MSTPTTAFGVYIHWPFCAQKCPYCDFNSHVRFGGWDEARFLSAYVRELDWVAQKISCTGEEQSVSSIFFGGGTPSLMKPQTVGAILDHIAKLWPVARDAEITLEANPGSVEAGRFKGYREAGVNRVSMGLQSLRDEDLKKLGRIHTVAEARAALDIARATFERYSFDLIYARPGQTPSQWRNELTEALDLADDHISLYQLTIEPDTPYAALHAAGKLVVPDEDAALALYEITQEITSMRRLAAYEISNHAKPGAESRHNLLYWRYGSYAGIGPGAHGRLLIDGVRHASVAERNPERWVERVEATGRGYVELTPLASAEEADEMLLMGLRLTEGVDLTRLAQLARVAPAGDVIDGLVRLGLVQRLDAPQASPSWRGNELDEIAMCLGPGMRPDHLPVEARPSQNRIRATPRGRFVLNAVVAELAASFAPAASGLTMDNPGVGN
ncbi:MAG: radical SAM family heme chaperone HemW [Hyphomicrobiaceae bacterium]